ncbi:MAG: esterase family protein [Treponema sp.]|jgi:S-formylglutathione hydrolase FrmB|nr:esterase family protein [Treponema sp.]
MAYINVSVYVPQAATNINVDLVFPTDGLLVDGRHEVKGVITLLHGLYGSGRDWIQLSAASRYAYDRGYILVCPSCGNSFYNNMAYGPPMYDIVVEHLPKQLDMIFKIPRDRDRNYIAGLSMGGYGAMRIGLLNPDRYAAIGSFSGALNAAAGIRAAAGTPYQNFFAPIFGDNLAVPDDADLLKIIPKAAAREGALKQRILVTCGRQDEADYQIHTQNQTFISAAGKAALDVTYREWDGVHVWNVWDRSLVEFIGFIENSDYAADERKNWTEDAV